MADDIDDRLRSVRPEADAVAKEKLRAEFSAWLRGVAAVPVKIGRYVILERLGQGGMGVVYSAYDPELDRKVAIKLLRPEPGREVETARRRLQREAQALARLDHPNVVPVHDVGVIDDRVFVVMELVRGQTLRQWVRDSTPRWRPIVDAYVQAGQGLAAAHALRLVHRDFKPDNALVGEDGRVRVVDFGLVRNSAADAGAPAPESTDTVVVSGEPTHALESADTVEQPAAGAHAPGPGSRNLSLTATGALMGTPAYMAPEQLGNADVGPAADQFSFCVSLYEALYGERPFAGASLEAIMLAVARGEVREPPRASRVPGWLHTVVCRGLAADPAARHPSMHALLDALRRDPARVRRNRLAALALAALVAALVYASTRPRPGVVEMCKGAEAELAGVWGKEARAAVERAVTGTGRPYAQEAWPRIAAGLDGYARRWVAMHEDACLAHKRGHQSSALLDRRMACLERRRSALASAVAVLTEIRADALGNAIEVVDKLAPVEYCGELEALLAEVPPPDDAERARRVAALRDRAGRAKALEDAGRYQEAFDVAASAVTEAEPLGYAPLLAELLLAQGRIAMNAGRRLDAVAPLRRAAEVALAAGVDRVAVEALARAIYSQGTLRGPSEALGAYLSMAEALSQRISDGFARALLLNNAGAMYMAAQDGDRARQYFERALAERDRMTGEVDIELDIILVNLAMLTVDDARRDELFQRVLSDFERRLGSTHPLTLARRVTYGHFVRDLGRARDITEQACTQLERYHPDRFDTLQWCLHYLGFLEAERGHTARAAEVLTHLGDVQSGEKETAVGRVIRGYAVLYAGAPDQALELLGSVAAELLRVEDLPWWRKKQLAHAWLGMGASELALGRPERAVEPLERAAAVYAELTALVPDMEHGQRLAWARMLLGRALWDAAPRSDSVRGRVLTLLDQAETWYRSAGPGYALRLGELAAWRRERGLVP